MSPFPLTKTASQWCKENIGDNEMNAYRIEVGDTVNICIDDSEEFVYFEAEILDTPVATGDAWKIKTKYDSLVYIQQYHTMTLVRKSG